MNPVGDDHGVFLGVIFVLKNKSIFLINITIFADCPVDIFKKLCPGMNTIDKNINSYLFEK
jgi:hypothetical protein